MTRWRVEGRVQPIAQLGKIQPREPQNCGVPEDNVKTDKKATPTLRQRFGTRNRTDTKLI